MTLNFAKDLLERGQKLLYGMKFISKIILRTFDDDKA